MTALYSFTSPNKAAYFFVDSELSNVILNAIVSGTESNIPTLPSNHPQKSNEKNTTKVERCGVQDLIMLMLMRRTGLV